MGAERERSATGEVDRKKKRSPPDRFPKFRELSFCELQKISENLCSIGPGRNLAKQHERGKGGKEMITETRARKSEGPAR